jgi:dipeptidyl aminopeptidase/acylaminoacyl peptidase
MRCIAGCLLVTAACGAIAQDDIAAKVAPYAEFRPSAMLSWDSTKREILVRTRVGGVEQVQLVSEPGAPPQPREAPAATGKDFTFSVDGKRVAFVEHVSPTQSSLWVMDVATKKKRRVTPAPSKRDPALYLSPRFSPDDRGLFAKSDRGSEFSRLVYLPLAGGPEVVLTADKFDVDEFAISEFAKRIAFTTNEAGSSVLRFLDLPSRREHPRPALLQGVITDLTWQPNANEIAFTVASARSAGDVFSFDVKENRTVRWTNGNNPKVNTSAFVEPRPIQWKSYDGTSVSAFHYHPAASFEGKRPVIISLPGAAGGQVRAGFIARDNYFVNELGIAVIYPNARGSRGFGKTFLAGSREDAMKDIATLLDWIATQPDLDAGRVLVAGGEFALTFAATPYAGRVAGVVDTPGDIFSATLEKARDLLVK